MFHVTEAEIMANWSENDPIRVSVCCITYKQEQYIAQAIDSFLMQKTTFPFEIIIGEDYGCDGTLSILEKYQACYPSLIRIVTSEKNVGINANFLRIFNAARGDYIAVCEGDDFWVSDNKLECQYNEMKMRPEIFFSFHKSSCILDGVKVNTLSQGDEIKLFKHEDMFESVGMIAATSSYMFSRALVNQLPVWFDKATVGDFFLEVYGMKDHAGLYIPTEMSAYRLAAVNSWSNQILNLDRYIETFNRLIDNYEWCRVDFGNDLVNRRIAKVCIMVASRCLQENNDELFKNYVKKATAANPYVSLKHYYYHLFIQHVWLIKITHKIFRLVRINK
ncbi:glycosyltransferase family 2 protein [Aeromonas caviae]|uniref:glycosyltransferase family 2 protein n=1 Tax=Aeromonas caviae TaxID=648 RepID=UPI00191DA034|nr:glycosyltransferase [Aeromonas caviae]MBL0500231.1 glycosyltransferase [Aeromonas caviae]